MFWFFFIKYLIFDKIMLIKKAENGIKKNKTICFSKKNKKE